jgi:hypothetical protein
VTLALLLFFLLDYQNIASVEQKNHKISFLDFFYLTVAIFKIAFLHIFENGKHNAQQ